QFVRDRGRQDHREGDVVLPRLSLHLAVEDVRDAGSQMREHRGAHHRVVPAHHVAGLIREEYHANGGCRRRVGAGPDHLDVDVVIQPEDRKSTRLNSSHVASSYAVFCLNKKIDDEVELINASPYGNAATIYTTSG